LFNNQHQSQQNQQDSVDRYLAQGIQDARAVLKPQPGEAHLRVHGQTKYADAREELFRSAERAGQKFWQGKVFLETVTETEWADTTKTSFLILANGVTVGEISEFDQKAKTLLDFDDEAKYFARAVIQDDLIGNVVHLFVDPVNRLS
jgi:hypothetical protein